MNLKYIKIIVIISFLLITYSGGTLTFITLIWLIIGSITNFLELFCFDCNHLESIKNLFILFSVIISIIFTFKKKPFWVYTSLFIQYSYLLYLFKVKYLNYWYFTIPTAVYLILSLTLIYNLFLHQKKSINN
jgi:hypothetical protein